MSSPALTFDTTALERILPAILPGPLVYVGCPDPARLAVLRDAGFEAAVLVWPPSEAERCRESLEHAVPVDVLDRGTLDLGGGNQALVVVDGVLSRLWPDEGDRLLARVRRATRPGGVACVSARTVDDPRYARRRAEDQPLARNTYHDRAGRIERYLMPGELGMAFRDWLILCAIERAGDAEAHRGAVVIARRPAAPTLLA